VAVHHPWRRSKNLTEFDFRNGFIIIINHKDLL
jgi:hypothetical protein